MRHTLLPTASVVSSRFAIKLLGRHAACNDGELHLQQGGAAQWKAPALRSVLILILKGGEQARVRKLLASASGPRTTMKVNCKAWSAPAVKGCGGTRPRQLLHEGWARPKQHLTLTLDLFTCLQWYSLSHSILRHFIWLALVPAVPAHAQPGSHIKQESIHWRKCTLVV